MLQAVTYMFSLLEGTTSSQLKPKSKKQIGEKKKTNKQRPPGKNLKFKNEEKKNPQKLQKARQLSI